MGEQRSRRTANKPAADLIDSGAGSRGLGAAPQPPQTQKARSERHRKSDRRREHRKPGRTRSDSKQGPGARHNNPNAANDSPERPANPRVNPIFVFVRQVDTRIVDVKCEDYDKRNRIVLTKTAQGWRAIPRTETLVPGLKEAADAEHHSHHRHHHHKSKKSKRTKCRRKSTAVQVEAEMQTSEPEEEPKDEFVAEPQEDLTWMAPVNIESLLPSHKIRVKKTPDRSPERDPSNVNSAASDDTQTQTKCSVDQINDVSPLDNLLAVAELEFNQQMQTDEWNKNIDPDMLDNQDGNLDSAIKFDDSMGDDSKQYMEQINDLIESCSNNNQKGEDSNDFLNNVTKEECDYNEEEDNNIAMDDILTRLEQSLRSPECNDVNKIVSMSTEPPTQAPAKEDIECYAIDVNDNNYKSVPEFESFFDENELKCSDNKSETEKPTTKPNTEPVVESSTTQEELPTDLSIKTIQNPEPIIPDVPTDLSIPKHKPLTPPPPLTIPRSPSQNSEAIQSPQPSGIPAVPPSPDIMPSATPTSKTKAVFLESLLSNNNNQKIALNSEVTIIRQNEPLDLGRCRKSASPTVTCSEEATDCIEPPTKKFKPEDITLKTLLDAESSKAESEKTVEKIPDTPRLLELLKTDSEPDPLTQLRQIVNDTSVNVPDPMLVPKEKLSSIISHPGKEIPKLLKQRPELRLPEALAYPHLLQDPDILVITLQQLETIIMKQGPSPALKEAEQEKVVEKPAQEKPVVEVVKQASKKKPEVSSKASSSSTEGNSKSGNIAELANDIDAATTAAFNQMMWLPYLNQLEAMSFNNNPELMKMFGNTIPPVYPGQMHDIHNLFMNNNNRFPPPMNFPMQPPVNFNNPLEMSMWQEAMMQANMLRPKNHFDNFNHKQNFREYFDKVNFPTNNKKHTSSNNRLASSSKQNLQNNFYPGAASASHPGFQNQFMNMPNQNARHNIQVPQFNPLMTQKPVNHQKHDYHHQKQHHKSNFANYYSHLAQEKQTQHKPPATPTTTTTNRPKLSCKAFANNFEREKPEVPKQTGQPIDLSGCAVPAGKLKVKQHLIDPANAAKLLKHHDDVPEVGSTTTSLEEMQDSHKHLWHPLFGK